MNRRTNNYCYSSNEQVMLKYEQYLSPYGRKVLSTLINLKKDRNNDHFKVISNESPQFRCRKPKVISFNEPEHSRLNDLVNENNNRNTAIHDLNTQSYNNDNLLLMCSNDLLKPALVEEVVTETKKNISHINDASSNNSCHLNNNTFASDIVVNETPNDVTWEQMFDSDILQCFEDTDSIIQNNANSNENSNNDNVTVKKSSLVAVTVDENKNISKFNIRDKNVTGNSNRKVENENLKMTKINVPKLNNERHNLRKEKYTTTVKKWLNHIDSTNIEHYCEDSHQNQEKANLNNLTIPVEEQITNRKRKKDTMIMNAKEKKSKRSIQAKLANKDGVMKYSKPVNIVEEQININNDNIMSAGNNNNTNLLETESENGNNLNVKTKVLKKANIKEKKAQTKVPIEHLKKPNAKLLREKTVKPKFVVPIKSQIPVKDITYKVVILNNLIDINAIAGDLEKFEEVEGAMTLVYSNEFCQLNNQHTDVTCSPEGIMFSFQETFYYIEGQIDGMKNIFFRMLSRNAIVSFDAKSALMYLIDQHELAPHGFNIYDAKIGTSLVNPDEPVDNFSEMQKLLGCRAEYTIATDCTLQKVAWYMTLLNECFSKLRSVMLEQGLWNVFVNIEMKILPIMAAMEHRGISIDVAKLKSMEDILLTHMKKIESKCHKAAGKVFQISSAVQVRALIYDELKLDTTSNVKIRETICKGAKSTSEAMLRSLISVHPLPKLILEYRHLHKAHATFLAGIAQHVQDGVVKPSWDQTAAATGRIASNNPNLQAIPKMPFNLLLFPSDDDKDRRALKFRSVYVCRRGHALLAADFKHVECRVFARAAAHAPLLAALRSPDLFRVLAANWLKKPESEVSPEDRERTKRIVYASLYGAGTRKLMEILDLGYDQVLSIMSSFSRTFPSLKSFGRSVVAQCSRQEGRLTTASGRARTFPNITSSDFRAKSHAERQAVNFIIQGTAADLCKMAMVQSVDRLRSFSPRVEAHLLLQIHDELVWEVLDEHLDIAAAIIKSAMENCGQVLGMAETLPIAMYKGTNWGEMEEFCPKPLD